MLLRARLVQASMAVGVIFFALVVNFLYMHNRAHPPVADAQILSLMNSLSLVNLGVFVTGWTLSPIVEKMLAQQAALNPPKNKLPEQARGELWLIQRIVALALREGSAFIGLVVCFLGVVHGALYTHPIYGLNALTAILMIVYAVVTFPREEDFEVDADPSTH